MLSVFINNARYHLCMSDTMMRQYILTKHSLTTLHSCGADLLLSAQHNNLSGIVVAEIVDCVLFSKIHGIFVK